MTDPLLAGPAPPAPSPAPAGRRQLWVVIAASVLALLALVGIGFCWFFAALSLCGVSGCSGGGFGVSYGGPTEVFPPLVVSGVLATVPFFVLGLGRGRRWWWLAALVALVLVPLTGAVLIGTGPDGYPLNR